MSASPSDRSAPETPRPRRNPTPRSPRVRIGGMLLGQLVLAAARPAVTEKP